MVLRTKSTSHRLRVRGYSGMRESRQPLSRNNNTKMRNDVPNACIDPDSREKSARSQSVHPFFRLACCARHANERLWLKNGNHNVSEQQDKPVYIIVGRAWREEDDVEAEGFHILLMAPDDDSAVRTALEALASEGYAKADLDQIGELDGQPDEEPHQSAWQGAMEGEVAIVTFEDPFGD